MLKEDKHCNNATLKGGAIIKGGAIKGGAEFSIRNTKMSPLKCHSLDCVPNVFKMLGITDKENAKFLASLYKKGVPEHVIYRFLNEEFKRPHLDEQIYNISDGQYRKFTEIESILELKNMEEYAKSIIKNNTALIGTMVYVGKEIRHLMVVANIENDVYLLDPQSNLSFNVSQIVRENNYTKELLQYIKRIIKISVIINLSKEYVPEYKKPFFTELLKYSLIHSENKNPLYLDIDKLKVGHKYQIIPNNKETPNLFGTFYSIVDGFTIFYIKGEIDAVNPRYYKFLEFVSRSAPTKSRSKLRSKSPSNKLNLQYIDMKELKHGQKYLILPIDKNELPLTGIFHLIEEGYAIFNIDGEREEISEDEYKFVKISKKNSITRRHKSA